jgi:GH24 family phage-related lysozyme (muramidase)
MHQSVLDGFYDFNIRFEGYVEHMYLDVKGLVTIGVGNLIDPVSQAELLPFRHKGNGQRATMAEVREEWHAIKAASRLAVQGARAAKGITRLYLTQSDIISLCRARLIANEYLLKKTFITWESFPAPAQTAILSMAWAMGGGFTKKWPLFKAACCAGDWEKAANECAIKSVGNPGIVPRNIRNRQLLLVAAGRLELPPL